MFKTIAWATDCSPSALNALAVAKGLARDMGGKLVIIHVQELTISRAGFFVDSNTAALAALHRTAEELRGEGIEATVLLSRSTAGGIARMILDLARKADADVIVVGNRGHGPLINVLLGGVASRLLQTASCPVLMVPSRPRPEASTVAADVTPGSAPSRA